MTDNSNLDFNSYWGKDWVCCEVCGQYRPPGTMHACPGGICSFPASEEAEIKPMTTTNDFCPKCGKPKYYIGDWQEGSIKPWCVCGLSVPAQYIPSTVEEWQTGYKTVPTLTGILLAVNELARQVAQLAEIEAREHDVLKRENERLRAKLNELMGDPK